MSRTAPRDDLPRGRRGIRALVVGLAAVAPYLLLPAQPFVFDAPLAIVENHAVQAGSPHEIFTTDFFGAPAASSYANLSYRPLVTSTYALQVRAFGHAPWAFHLVDMLLHAAASVAVLLLLGALGVGGRFRIVAALLFAVHPVASETVASVVGRADLMASLGLLLALLLHLGAPDRRRPVLHEAGALGALAATLLCKEYAVAFPFLLIAFDEIVRAGRRGERRETKRPWGTWAGALLLLAAYAGGRLAVLGAIGTPPGFTPVDNPLAGEPWWVRFGTASSILSHAARLLLLPVGLSHHYAGGSLPVVPGLLDPRALVPAAGIALAAALAILGLRRRGWVAPPAALLLFLLPLLPSLNTVGITGVLFAERWLYLPLAGFAILVGWILERVPGRAPWRRAAWTVSVSALVLLAGITAVRVHDWGSPGRLAESALRYYPRTAKVWHELGISREQSGRTAEAADAFRRSLDLDPSNPRVFMSYANVLTRLGRHRESAEAWRRLIALAPKEIAALWTGLGEAELAAGDLDEATRALSKAHELAPSDAGVGSRLADCLFARGLTASRSGATNEARSWFREALSTNPEILRRRHESAVRLESAKRYGEAAAVYREILAADPDHAPTLFNLGRVLLLAARPEEATEALLRGLAIQEDPRARAILAEARRRMAGAR
jgi:tetratricopeptide (TPR) repeat protein